MRWHPGTGDPAGFGLVIAGTQRNLSDEGRASHRIGDLFRENGIAEARVYTSQWCRCRDTASSSARPGGGAKPAQFLLRKPSDGKPQTEALAAWINTAPRQTVILVTHQVNITGLTDVVPQSGELVFVASGAGEALRVIGRLEDGGVRGLPARRHGDSRAPSTGTAPTLAH